MNTYFGYTKEEIIKLYNEALNLRKKFVVPEKEVKKSSLENIVDNSKAKTLKKNYK